MLEFLENPPELCLEVRNAEVRSGQLWNTDSSIPHRPQCGFEFTDVTVVKIDDPIGKSGHIDALPDRGVRIN
jgi:hypothetical protein